MLTITALYAGILGLFALALSALAGTMRGRLGIPIGDGGNKEMLLAMRRHTNFVEYVPLILILIGLLEMNGVSPMWLHIFGAALVLARLSHASALRANSVNNLGRTVGAAGTALVLVVTAIWCIVVSF